MDWDSITADVSAFVTAVAPVVEGFEPELAPAVAIAAKIIQGVIAEEPAAKALWDQITGGTQVTADQLQQYAADYESSYHKLNADIAAQIAAAGG